MPTAAKRLIDPQQLTTANTAYYTAPVSGTYTVVRNLTFTNTTGSGATVTVYIVPVDIAASVANCLSYTRSVPPGGTWQASDAIGHVLNPGDSVYMMASANNTITAMLSGVEVT